MFIKYNFDEEFVEVESGWPPQKINFSKTCSGQLLGKAEKLKDILDLLPYIPAVNHPFYGNLWA
jgi:hypothetical protein